MKIEDEQINSLIKERNLLMQSDSAQELIDVVNKKIKDRLDSICVTNTNLEEKKMVEDKVQNVAEQKPAVKPVVAKPAKVVKQKVAKVAKVAKPKVEGCDTFVIKALQMKTTKDREGVVKKVKEMAPKFTIEKIKGSLNRVLTYIRNKKEKRWNNYVWDEKAFLLTKKD